MANDIVRCKECGDEVHKDRALPVMPSSSGIMTYCCEDCISVQTEEKRNQLKSMGFKEQVEALENGCCPFCKKPTEESQMRDYFSRMEFRLSGMCQECQDDFFEKAESDWSAEARLDA